MNTMHTESTSSTSAERGPERVKGWRKLVAVGALAPVALIAACASNNAEAQPAPAASVTTEQPAQTEAPATPELGVAPEVVQRYVDMPAADFLALDPQEQAVLVSWYYKNPTHWNQNVQPFELEEGFPSGVTQPENNPVDVASPDNTAREIVDQINFAQDVYISAEYRDELSHEIFADTETASKLLAGVFLYTDVNAGTEGAGYLRGELQRFEDWGDTTAANLGYGELEALGATELREGTDQQGSPMQYRDITVRQALSGDAQVLRVTYTTMTGYDGEQFSQWKIADQWETTLEDLGDVDQ